MKIRHLTLWMTFVITQTTCAQTLQQIENIEAFNRLYGYVRYFHPSDESSAINWDKFAIHGCQEVAGCKDRKCLKQTLVRLFRPIAPTVAIFYSAAPVTFNESVITPRGMENFRTVTWQHLGVGLSFKSVYKSLRLNRAVPGTAGAGSLFDQHAQVGEYVQKDIGGGLSVIVPVALFGTKKYTYPKANVKLFKQLQETLEQYQELSGNDLYVRLGDLVITWNIFQHFYPYFDVAGTNWPVEFREAVKGAFRDKTEYDFLKTLRKFTAKLKDGHVWVSSSATHETEGYRLPIAWEWIENELVITDVLMDSLPLQRGDIVRAIDGRPVREYFDDIGAYVSAATAGWLDYQTRRSALMGYKGSAVTLDIYNDNAPTRRVTIYRNPSPVNKVRASASIEKISDEVYYINISKASIDEIREALPVLEKCRSVICDLRGYPNGNHELIQYLLHQRDTSERWMRIPQIIYPDQERIAGYKCLGWGLRPKNVRLQGEIYFLINGQAISYAESFMSFIEHYRLATIVGQPSAGTNGNINPFTLPGNYRISWTGMKVLKHNGTQHHGIGILPHVYVERTIRGVKENRDEYLEKALELAAKDRMN